jgi:hypothetical protein
LRNFRLLTQDRAARGGNVGTTYSMWIPRPAAAKEAPAPAPLPNSVTDEYGNKMR